MNYTKVHSLLSKASEAIVTQDGKVKRRLNNYETVVGENGKDDPFYIPTGAVNDNYGNLNHLTNQIRNQSVNSRLSQLRYVMFGAFALIILVFAWTIYNFLLPTTIEVASTDTQTVIDPSDPLVQMVNETQLERVSNLIIRDGDWTNARIILFLKHWNASNEEAQENFKTMAWFQHFHYRLETKFNESIYTGELLNNDTQTNSSIMTLALVMGIADPKIDYAAKIENDNSYEKLESVVASELAKMEQRKLASNSSDEQIVVDEVALSRLLKDKNGKPLLADRVAFVAPVDPEQKYNLPENTQVQVAAAVPPSISEQDVSRVLQKYTSAYERGDFQDMSTLFGVKDPKEGERIIESLKSNYENIFSNSKKRSVKFQGINWRFDGDKAIVNSDYSAKIELNNNKGTQTVTANAMLGLHKRDNSLKISSFELLNRSVSVVTPELNLPSTKKSSSTKKKRQAPITPTAAELQDIVTRLVASYENGDIAMFSGLFSTNAKTNDQQNLTGIKNDYAELFKSSNDRQMFIQGMQWSYDNQHAKGTGDLEAIVLSESGQSVYSMAGKIQLVAQRINGKVQITHMYHIERAK